MPLTIEDVQKKMFTPVRLREGYDTGEVDQFLDEVESELTRLHAEIEELRAREVGASADAPAPAGEEPTADATSDAVAAPAAPRSVQEASGAAARLLELATNSADQLVGEARENADALLAEARATAERVDSETRSKAEELESAARARLEQLEAETASRREQLLSDLEHDKDSVSQELAELRAFEREYRTRLKAYFEAQLAALDASTDPVEGAVGDEAPESPPAPHPPSADEDVPRRLRELLGDDA